MHFFDFRFLSPKKIFMWLYHVYGKLCKKTTAWIFESFLKMKHACLAVSHLARMGVRQSFRLL